MDIAAAHPTISLDTSKVILLIIILILKEDKIFYTD